MKIALASCANINEVPDQPVWQEIGDQGPDLLLLLGDQIYYNLLSPDPEPSPAAFESRLRSEYEKQWAEPHFKGLLESGIPWTAVWDDHDYAWNNAGGGVDSDRKVRTTRLFLDYQHGNIDPERTTVHHDFVRDGVHFIMLDGRTWRESPGPTATPLGAEQENFLWDKLAQPAALRVVACGSPLTFGRFSLSDYPAFTRRLAEFLHARDLRIIFLGGDVHDNAYHAEGRIIELISSGVARKYLLATKRNYCLLKLDLPAGKIVYEMHSRSKVRFASFDLETWEEE